MFNTPSKKSKVRVLETLSGTKKKSSKTKCFVMDSRDTPVVRSSGQMVATEWAIERTGMLLRSGFDFQSPVMRTRSKSMFFLD
jgi:hypothetical protein